MLEIDKRKVVDLLENKGKTKDEIRLELYPDLGKGQWAIAWDQMGLKGRKPRKIDFVIVGMDESEEAPVKTSVEQVMESEVMEGNNVSSEPKEEPVDAYGTF